MRTEILKIIKETKVDGLTKKLKSFPQYWSEIDDDSADKGVEKIYRYVHNLTEKEKCLCGKEKKFVSFTKGYNEFCSGKCDFKTSAQTERRLVALEKNGGIGLARESSKKKAQQTLLKKHNVVNPGQLDSHKKRMSENNPMSSEEGKYNFKQTIQQKYNRKKMRVKWSEELNKLFEDDQQFENEFNEYGAYYLAEKYNVHYGTFFRHANKLGIRIPNKSSLEESFKSEFNEYNVISNTRKVISPLELDIFFPDHNVAIELCGLYWHSELYFDTQSKDAKTYHKTKLDMCASNNIRLFTIFEDEWINHKDICISRIRQALNENKLVTGARKLSIQKVPTSEASKFFDTYHLQNTNSQGNIVYGAYHNGKLVSAMSFGKSRFEQDKFELIRFCSNGNYAGVASRLFKRFLLDYNPDTVISYCDLRWGTGSVYRKLGFDELSTTSPNFWYFKNQKRYHRLNYTKASLVKLGNDPNLSAWDIMQSNGWNRIWDCGSIKFEWTKK